MEIEVNHDLLTIMLLYSLPPRFKNFRCAIESRDDLPSPDVLRVKILQEADARKNDTRNVLSNAMIARRSENKRQMGDKKGYGDKSKKHEFPYKCRICHKLGHKAVNCPGVNSNNAENLSL